MKLGHNPVVVVYHEGCARKESRRLSPPSRVARVNFVFCGRDASYRCWVGECLSPHLSAIGAAPSLTAAPRDKP